MSNQKIKRHYQGLWEAIRASDSVVIGCSNPLQAKRIIKAVRKEKWLDDSFKLVNPLERFRLMAEVREEEGTILFVLEKKLGIAETNDVSENNLTEALT